jgi:hypothetical protein
MLRAVPPMFGSQFPGVAVMGAATMILFALPWLDRGRVKSIRYRGTKYRTWFALFVVSFLLLGYLGVEPTTVWGEFSKGLPIVGGDYIALWAARVLTVVYFLFVLMPWYTWRQQALSGAGGVVMRESSPTSARLPAIAFASSGGVQLEHAPINLRPSLQRGAAIFVNHCLNCHSASAMHYARLRDSASPKTRSATTSCSPRIRSARPCPRRPTPPWRGGVGRGAADLSLVGRSRGSIGSTRTCARSIAIRSPKGAGTTPSSPTSRCARVVGIPGRAGPRGGKPHGPEHGRPVVHSSSCSSGREPVARRATSTHRSRRLPLVRGRPAKRPQVLGNLALFCSRVSR